MTDLEMMDQERYSVECLELQIDFLQELIFAAILSHLIFLQLMNEEQGHYVGNSNLIIIQNNSY